MYSIFKKLKFVFHHFDMYIFCQHFSNAVCWSNQFEDFYVSHQGSGFCVRPLVFGNEDDKKIDKSDFKKIF